MKRPVVHVVGAGAAGLAAARALVNATACASSCTRRSLTLGGRRRSFPDEALPRDFDTGAFLLLSGWKATLALIDAAGARGEWRTEAQAGVAFADLATGERWRIAPNAGRLPWWLLDARRRGPNLRLGDFWAALLLLDAPADATVQSLAPKGAALERLWRPLTVAALNCPPETASARLLGAVLRDVVAAGGAGLRILTPKRGFGRAFVEPLARSLDRDGATLRYGRRLTGLGLVSNASRISNSSTIASISGPKTRRSWRRRGRRPRRSSPERRRRKRRRRR